VGSTTSYQFGGGGGLDSFHYLGLLVYYLFIGVILSFYYLGLLAVVFMGRDYLEDRGPFIILSSFELTTMRGQASRPWP